MGKRPRTRLCPEEDSCALRRELGFCTMSLLRESALKKFKVTDNCEALAIAFF